MVNSNCLNKTLLFVLIIITSANTLFAKGDFPDISSTSFLYQQECLHHDNFHREILNSQKLWQIGTNDPKGKSMNYHSPY